MGYPSTGSGDISGQVVDIRGQVVEKSVDW